MRILLLSTHLDIGGIPRYLLGLSGELARLGHTVFVATAGGKWEGRLRENGAEHISIDIRTKNEFHPKVWRAFWRLLDFVAKNRIEILHAHTRVTQVVAALLSRFLKIPYVTTCHGFYQRRLGRRLFPCWGEKVIAISETVRAHLVDDFGLEERRVVLIPNGVDVRQCQRVEGEEKRRLRGQLGLPEEGKILGSVSRLVKAKGHDALLHAMASLRKDHPELSLVLIGEGEFRRHLEALSRELGISDRVFFKGEVEEPIPYLSIFDIFVHPAEWNEGFGLAVAEAMACGVPVVASRNEKGGLGMFISHQKSGYLLEGNAPRLLQAAIDDLLRNPEFCETMGENGQRIIEEKFSIGRMVNEIIPVYEEVLR